mgnify:CR=1 FL=1|jgi:hypothetical protein
MAPNFLLTRTNEEEEILGAQVDPLIFHHDKKIKPNYEEQPNGSLLVEIPEEQAIQGQTAIAKVAVEMGLQVQRVREMV